MAQSNLLHELTSAGNVAAVRIFSRDLCRSCEQQEALPSEVLCGNCEARRALVLDAFTRRFPRARAAAEAIAFAELLRQTASELDSFADRADLYEATSLRRVVHGAVRALVATLAGQVTL